MTMTDPVSDFLTRIRNACGARHETVDIPSSKLKLEMARLLKEEGYIEGYHHISDNKQGVIRIQLRYTAGKTPVITSLERVSRPAVCTGVRPRSRRCSEGWESASSPRHTGF